jgi:hypothetical protein
MKSDYEIEEFQKRSQARYDDSVRHADEQCKRMIDENEKQTDRIVAAIESLEEMIRYQHDNR